MGGYYLGDNIHRLTGPVGPITIALGLLITIASLAFVRRNEQRLEEEAERALPGPLDGPEPVERVGQDRRQKIGLRRDTSDRLSGDWAGDSRITRGRIGRFSIRPILLYEKEKCLMQGKLS